MYLECMLDRRIELLRMIAHLGTVTEAAHALYRSPSGVSRQIQELAKELGVELLQPEGRRVKLTPAGKALVEYADETHHRWEATRSRLTTTEEPAGSITLVAHPSAVTALIAPLLPQLAQEHPGVQLHVIEDQAPGSFHRLTTGEADLCLAVVEEGIPARGDSSFHQTDLGKEPIDALLPVGHQLAEKTTVSLRELADEAWVVPAPGQASHHEVMTACHAAGFTPTVVHYARDWAAVGALVHATGAVSLTSRFAPYHHPNTRQVALTGEPTPTRQLLLATRAGSENAPLIRLVAAQLEDCALS